jgi:hypothetical protein
MTDLEKMVYFSAWQAEENDETETPEQPQSVHSSSQSQDMHISVI